MHIYTLDKWQHKHDFTAISPANERKTLSVVLLTAGMMGLEIVAGAFFGSMALLADGWRSWRWWRAASWVGFGWTQ